MKAATVIFIVLSLHMAMCIALPWQAQLEKMKQLRKLMMDDGAQYSFGTPAQPSVLGQLDSLHVVGLAAHPDEEKLLYADETAVYEFHKTTGKSERIVGSSSAGLRIDRQSQDGVAADARFSYITKIVVRPSGVYIFDSDRLRKLNLGTKEVTTIAVLVNKEEKPITGTVSHDEKFYIWRGTGGEGRFVVKTDLTNPAAEPKLLPAGSSLIPYMDISPDDQFLYLSDVEMNIIEKVDIASGDISFVTDYSSSISLLPGAIVSASNDEILAVDRNSKSVSRYDVTKEPASVSPLCSTCQFKISNPFDIAAGRNGDIYVLDTKFHGTYPTYKFFITKVPSKKSSQSSLYNFL